MTPRATSRRTGDLRRSPVGSRSARVPRALGRGLVSWGLLAGSLASCAAERTLTITSEPPRALVRLGDELVGETPLTVEFIHYGPRRVTLYRPGYRTDSRRVNVDPPWYGYFPLDVVSEVLLPMGWSDRHRVHFELTEGAEHERPDLRSVLDRAEVLRRAGPDGPRDLPPVVTVTTQRGPAAEPLEDPAAEPPEDPAADSPEDPAADSPEDAAAEPPAGTDEEPSGGESPAAADGRR